jgi:hypothetical protein
MRPEFGLTNQHFNTCFGPLCVVGQAIRDHGTLEALLNFDLISMKTRDHAPGEKLMDAFLLILAGYPSLYLLNRHLRPDPMLAQAWGQIRLADQSSISRTLDACDEPALTALQSISWAFWQQHSQLSDHDWRQKVILDLDLTPLRASPHAQDSTKGYLGKKMRPADNWPG